MGSYRSSSLKCALSCTESWHWAPTRSAIRTPAGLFERQDKHSPLVPDRYFSSLSWRDFLGSQLNGAHASANDDSIHLCFCRTNQKLGFSRQPAIEIDGRLVLRCFDRLCLSSLILFVCFMALQQPPYPPLHVMWQGPPFPRVCGSNFAPSVLRCST